MLLLATPALARVDGGCKDVVAPDPVSQSLPIGKLLGQDVNGTFTWFEEPEGTWTLKLDINPIGGQEDWVTEYPNWWGDNRPFYNLTKPLKLPQTIVEYTCPSKDKTVKIVESCDGSATVAIYGGDTRRTWRVNGEEKWVEKYATVEWTTTVPVTVEWWHENSSAWKPADEAYVTRTAAENCPVPVATPSATPVVTVLPNTGGNDYLVWVGYVLAFCLGGVVGWAVNKK